MLATLNDVLPQAKREGYGVGLFNTVDLEMAKGVLAAAENLRSPVIIGTAEVLLPAASLQELADILIVAATWLWEAKAEAGDNFQPGRSIDVMLLTGAVQFVCGQMADQHDIERLRTVVNLKMRYNELRKD